MANKSTSTGSSRSWQICLFSFRKACICSDLSIQLRLPADSSPQSEKMHSTNAFDAGAASRSWASGLLDDAVRALSSCSEVDRINSTCSLSSLCQVPCHLCCRRMWTVHSWWSNTLLDLHLGRQKWKWLRAEEVAGWSPSGHRADHAEDEVPLPLLSHSWTMLLFAAWSTAAWSGAMSTWESEGLSRHAAVLLLLAVDWSRLQWATLSMQFDDGGHATSLMSVSSLGLTNIIKYVKMGHTMRQWAQKISGHVDMSNDNVWVTWHICDHKRLDNIKILLQKTILILISVLLMTVWFLILNTFSSQINS